MEGPEEEKIWDGKFLVGIVSADRRPFLFSHKTVDGFHSIADPLVVDSIVHILTILIGDQNASILQNSKMLRSNGLLNLEGVVDLIDLDIFVLIQKFQNLESEWVSKSSHKFCRHR
jgi:hypothetical protein